MIDNVLFASFYVVAIVVLILHFSGWLEAHNLQWLVFLIAGLVFPVVLFL